MQLPGSISPMRSSIAAGAIGLAAVVAAAHAQSPAAAGYPTKPVKLIVGFAAGGPADIVARVVGARLGDALGQQFVVENRGGAGGTIGTEAVARAEPDGYTLLMTPLANAVNESLYKDRRIKLDVHLMAVAPLAETGHVLVVHPSLPVNSVADLIALAKGRPGEIVYASAGRGTAVHLASELFNLMAGVKMNPVHYRGGGETVKDLLTGEVKVMFSTIPPVLQYVQSGALRGIATTAPRRNAALPGLPTVHETLPGFDVRLWLALLGPVGLPAPVVERLSDTVGTVLRTPEMKAALAAQGFDPLIGRTADFALFYRVEVAKWAKVVQATGMTGE